MTATALLTRGLDSWGMDTDRATRWQEKAACLGDWWSFTEQLMPPGDVGMSAKTVSAHAAHRCNTHCPVLLQCQLAAETPGQRPIEMVQAGLWWPSVASRPPRTLPDPGCTDRCRHLRGAHRGR